VSSGSSVSDGRRTVSAHRFRNTIGTQLAERHSEGNARWWEYTSVTIWVITGLLTATFRVEEAEQIRLLRTVAPAGRIVLSWVMLAGSG